MKDTKNLTIAILGITALVLLAMLIGVKLETTAYAGTAIKQNDWIMVSAQATKSVDLLYVVNVGQRKMVVYVPNRTANPPKIEKHDSVDLNDLFSK